MKTTNKSNMLKIRKNLTLHGIAWSCVFAIPFAVHFALQKDQKAENNSQDQTLNVSSAKFNKEDGLNIQPKGTLRNETGREKFLEKLLASEGEYEAARDAFLQWLEEDTEDALANIWLMHEYLHDYRLSLKDFGDSIGDYLHGKYGSQQSAEILSFFSYNEQLIRLTYERLVEKWVVEDPIAFKNWWQNSPLVNHEHSIDRLIAAQFAEGDPVQHIKFHEDLAPSDNRKEYVMTSAYEHFVDHHQDVAIEYLDTLDPTKFANEAHWKLAVNAAKNASFPIERAVSWANRIHENETDRASTLATAISEYAVNRYDEYQNWLATTTFFEDQNIVREEFVALVNHIAETTSMGLELRASQSDEDLANGPYARN